MKISEKLEHLSNEQLNDLMDRYYKNNEKVADLIKEFNIKVRPSSLLTLFPPIIHEEMFCPYCEGQNFVSKRPSRDNNSSYMNIPFCPSCKHKYEENCYCNNCKVATKRKNEFIKQTKMEIIQSEHEDAYVELVEPNILTLKDAVYILSLVRHSISEDFETVEPFEDDPIPLAINFEYQNEMVKHLYYKSYISISENSSIESFEYDDELSETKAYFPMRVVWVFLPRNSLNDKKKFIRNLENFVQNETWPEHWEAEKNRLWSSIAKMDCLDNFQHLLQERRFEIKTFGEKAHSVFENLLCNFSIGQIFNLSWQTVRDTTDYLAKKNLSRSHANNMFIGALQRKADKYLAEGWSVKNARRNYDCPQSALSSTYFNVFLSLGDKALEALTPRE